MLHVKCVLTAIKTKYRFEPNIEAFKILLPMQKEILSLSGEVTDEGTNALMSDYIRAQEKLVWMYSAFMAI